MEYCTVPHRIGDYCPRMHRKGGVVGVVEISPGFIVDYNRYVPPENRPVIKACLAEFFGKHGQPSDEEQKDTSLDSGDDRSSVAPHNID